MNQNEFPVNSFAFMATSKQFYRRAAGAVCNRKATSETDGAADKE